MMVKDRKIKELERTVAELEKSLDIYKKMVFLQIDMSKLTRPLIEIGMKTLMEHKQ